MNQIEPIAAYLPYMTCVGNHENAFNFSNYVNLFSMPRINKSDVGGDNNFFYSVNIGPIHLIGISTEFYYYINYGIEQIIRQYKWLENDLKVILIENSLIELNLTKLFRKRLQIYQKTEPNSHVTKLRTYKLKKYISKIS